MNEASQPALGTDSAASLQTQTPSSHLRTSCDRCKRMKIKCEWRGVSCVHCIARGASCDVTPVERKKKAKTQSSMQTIESRIERLESVLTASGIDPNNLAEATKNVDDLPQDVTDRLAMLQISEGGASRFFGASSGLSLFSAQGLQWISNRTGPEELSKFISILSKTNESQWPVNSADLWHAMPSSEREPLPPKEVADIFVDCFFDTFNSVLPLFDKSTFYDRYTLEYPQTPFGGTAWYACLNVVLGMGSMIWSNFNQGKGQHSRAATDGFEQEQGWKYFRNACSCITDLMFKACNLMAVQAIIGMAFLQQTTLDPQTFYVLVAAAGRLAHGIGLHRNLDHVGLSELEIDQRRNVFWIVYILDKGLSLRVGHPSVMIDDDIGVDLPRARSTRETTPNGTDLLPIFRSQAELSILESRIYTELYSVRARNRSHLERLGSVGKLDTALLEWKDKLPVEIRPEEPIQCAKEQEVGVIMLHFAYFNCLTTIHRISNSGSWTDQNARKESPSVDEGHLNSRIYASHLICLSAARSSIKLLKMVDLVTGTPRDHVIWAALYYPLSGFLTLFANLLQNPEDPYIPSDIVLMDLVRSFLSPSALGSMPFNAKTICQMFTELVSIARRFVAKTSSQNMNKAKRIYERDEERDWSMLSKESATTYYSHGEIQNFVRTDARTQASTSESFYTPSAESIAATDTPAFRPQDSSSARIGLHSQFLSELSSSGAEMPHSTNNDLSLSNATEISMKLQESASMVDKQELQWEVSMFSELSEWDLATFMY